MWGQWGYAQALLHLLTRMHPTALASRPCKQCLASTQRYSAATPRADHWQPHGQPPPQASAQQPGPVQPQVWASELGRSEARRERQTACPCRHCSPQDGTAVPAQRCRMGTQVDCSTCGQVLEGGQPHALHRRRGVLHTRQHQRQRPGQHCVQAGIAELLQPPGQLAGHHCSLERPGAWAAPAQLSWQAQLRLASSLGGDGLRA